MTTAEEAFSENAVRRALTGREGVLWIRILPQNGKSKIMVATDCNTERIRKSLKRLFRERVNGSPSVNGLEVIVEHHPPLGQRNGSLAFH